MQSKRSISKVKQNFPSVLSFGFQYLLRFHLFSLTKSQGSEAVVQRCSVKKMSLNIFKNSQESTGTRASFLIQLQTSGLSRVTSLKKESGTGVLCEFLELFQSTFFNRTLLVHASESYMLFLSKDIFLFLGRCFLENFAKFLRAPFLQNIYG